MLHTVQRCAQCSAGRSEVLGAVQFCALSIAARCVALRTVQRCALYIRCAEIKCKRTQLVKRFESLLHWQCFVERCAVPPLAAALGFSCEGLGSVAAPEPPLPAALDLLLRRAYCREQGLCQCLTLPINCLCTSLTSARLSGAAAPRTPASRCAGLPPAEGLLPRAPLLGAS